MDLADLAQHAGRWLTEDATDSDVVVSTRIRLARNLADFPFVAKADLKQKKEVETLVCNKLASLGFARSLEYLELESIGEVDRQLLMERHLISKEHVECEGPRGVAIAAGELLSIMVNEEDHLRIQVMRPGMQLDDAWESMNEVDDHLEQGLRFAFSNQLGYLSACPTNVGTGMRTSVMLHLPALVQTKHIEKVFQAVSKINLAVRGLYGEGTQAFGNFFQISNQITLGRSEADIVKNVKSVVPQIVQYERRARRSLLEDARHQVEDQAWRAYGTLKTARTVSSNETTDNLSRLRLGITLGIIEGVDIRTVNELLVLTQPAHLQKRLGKELEPLQRDIARATFIRQSLGEL